MFDDYQRASSFSETTSTPDESVGKRPLTAGLVQRKAQGPASSGSSTETTDTDLATASQRGGLDSFDFALQLKSAEGASGGGGGGGSGGMPASVQAKMETAFGSDFSNVQIHANSSDATAMGALAYTQGTDIHFAPGQYDPGSSAGQELLGHELAHVVQQSEGRVAPTTEIQG